MDYACNDRDLRVKKDVSDLKLDPLFWRRVLGKNYFFASYRIHPSAAIRPVCGALSRQLQGQSVFVLGSVFVHGLCATNLSRESARHRRLSGRARSDQLYHLGFRSRVCRSTLADANEVRDWRIYADLAALLIKRARRLYAGQEMDVELQQSVYALDSTTIDLCLNLFPWARFRSTKAAIKLHTLLDLRGPIPSFLAIIDGRCHDINSLDVLIVEPGAFYIMDRGYLDFSRLHTLHQAGAYFVIRARKDLRFVRYVSQPIDPDTGLCHWTTSRVLLAQGFPRQTTHGAFLRQRTGSSVLFPKQPSAAAGANYLPTLQDALAGGTVLQVDQAASANQALLRKLDQRSQNSGLDRSVRLRAGGDLEERTATAAKFTQHFTSFKCQRV